MSKLKKVLKLFKIIDFVGRHKVYYFLDMGYQKT